jgi:GNAT superfamily N-acetyltransferase
MAERRILPATKGDVRWVVGREFVHLPPVDPAFAPENMGWFRRLLLRYIALPASYRQRLKGYILHQDDRRIGYIYVGLGSVALNIDALAVEQEFRRRGYGGQLLTYAEKVAHEEGLTFLSARMPPENLPANAFFNLHGFRPYRSEIWRLKDVASFVEEASGASIRELSPMAIIQEYEKWMGKELEHGDVWVQGLILAEYPRMAFRARGRHWACLLDEKEVGYLRIAGLRGRFDAYLASDPSLWSRDAQLAWLAQAIACYPVLPSEVVLYLGSGGHYVASKEVFKKSGFESLLRQRYLLVKPLIESK